MLFGERHRWDAIAASVSHYLAARVRDESAHRRKELADVLVRRRARGDDAIALVSVFVGRRYRDRLHLDVLVADVSGCIDGGDVDLGRVHAHTHSRVGEIVTQAQRRIC